MECYTFHLIEFFLSHLCISPGSSVVLLNKSGFLLYNSCLVRTFQSLIKIVNQFEDQALVMIPAINIFIAKIFKFVF